MKFYGIIFLVLRHCDDILPNKDLRLFISSFLCPNQGAKIEAKDLHFLLGSNLVRKRFSHFVSQKEKRKHSSNSIPRVLPTKLTKPFSDSVLSTLVHTANPSIVKITSFLC